MKSLVSIRWIAGFLIALAGATATQAQQPSAFRARMAAWQGEQSRLVRQPARPGVTRPDVAVPPASNAPLPGSSYEPMPETMPQPMPPMNSAAPAPSRTRSSVQPGPAMPPGTVMGQSIVEEHPGGYLEGEYVDEGYYGDEYYGGPTCGPGGCGPAGCCGPLGGLFSCGLFCNDCSPVGGNVQIDPCCGPSLWWMDVDFTFGWRRGKGYPPLVTGEPDGVRPDAEVLYKTNQHTSQMQPGMRLDFGTWVDQCQVFGVGGRFWFLGKDSGRFHVNSDQSPVIGRPFYDIDNETNDALLVAFPGLREGDLTIWSNNEVLGADVYARWLLMHTCHGRLDLTGGYQFARINDDLRIESNTEAIATDGTITTGTTFRIVDDFATRNEFHGGTIGMIWERQCCNWTMTTMGRVGLGNMQQTAAVNGFNTITVPGQTSTTTAGGLLTADSNIGRESRNEFCAVPEFNLSLAYRIRPCMELSVGYSFMYFSDVLRPGDIIDTTIDTDTALATRPALIFNSSSFWVQGLNLGVHYDF